MRRTLAIAVIATLAATAVSAGGATRTLTLSQPVEGVSEVAIRGGVGDIEFVATDAATISVTVEVRPSKDSWFGSARAEREIEALELRGNIQGGTLRLSLANAPDHDRKFSENWSVQIPRQLAVSVKHGVGDVRVLDVAGEIGIELGVGDIRIEGDYASFGRIHATCGVGEVELRTPEGREEGDGFIGHTLSAKGDGNARIEAKAGVGDITIRLR